MAWPSKSNRATKSKRAKESGKVGVKKKKILFTWNTVNEHTSLSFFYKVSSKNKVITTGFCIGLQFESIWRQQNSLYYTQVPDMLGCLRNMINYSWVIPSLHVLR